MALIHVPIQLYYCLDTERDWNNRKRPRWMLQNKVKEGFRIKTLPGPVCSIVALELLWRVCRCLLVFAFNETAAAAL